jgi:GDP-L-fucose synthase
MKKKIWVTGHKGMVGSAMVRALSDADADLLLTSRTNLDLCDQADVLSWMTHNRPNYVFHIGAKVGGIMANKMMPADFIYDNLMVQTNVIHAAKKAGVEKLLFVASNCTYPNGAPQPIKESALLTGPLEENIQAYAVSKIAGIEMCRAYRKQYGCDFSVVIPPNLYGPGDNYHPEHGHVVAGILRRAHEAKVAGHKDLVVWGDGTARRELLYADDLAVAMKHVMFAESEHDLLNVGFGSDLAINELVEIIIEIVGFKGVVAYDTTKPSGTKGKLLDSTRITSLGWRPKTSPKEGLKAAYQDFLQRFANNAEVTE